METSDPSGRLTAEDLSDCISDSSHSESQLRAFQSYERIKELNLSIDKSKEDASTESKDFHLGLESGDRTSLRFNEFPCENPARNLTMTLNKTKDFDYSANNFSEINYPLDRSNENEESVDATTTLCRSKNSSAKNVLFNLRETKQRSPHASLSSLDRYSKDLNFVVEKEMKDFSLLKNYNLDRMKEFNFSLDRMRDTHISSLALERLRGGTGLLENSNMLDHKEFRNLQVQPRNPDLEAIALERMRRSHLLGTELSAQNLSTQVPHPHSITHMQHSQQQQQQQAKSFTIDAILGLRNNQREKRNQQQQYRKHQGQESSTKNSSSSSSSSGGGKVKRVRTIFTAEQLERLEGEFARQQYMVGPERLYLAHALRLTEAQVKVWFQNRRIKWRKLHHEQQSQRVHEFQRTLNSSLEHEDSNETDKCFLTRMEQIGRLKTKYTSPHTWSAKQTTDTRIPADAYWKYTQRNNQDMTDQNIRRRQSPIPESTMSYYSSANSHKSFKHNAYPCSTHPKHSSVLHTEVPQRYQQITKSGRNKDRTNNVAVINKDRYKTQQEDENNAEYIDEELGNFTEDNLEDAEEEAENERSLRSDERVGESINKEYDEQEADDEIDEESDVPAESQAIQRNATKKDALLRAQQRTRISQQDPHRIRHSQYSPKLYQAYHLPTRYYHNMPDHDVHETLSEEDLYTAQALKNPPRRSSMGYHQNWIPQRNSADRYDTMTSLTQPSRRTRTRPEIKSFTEAEFADRRKCSRCGNISIRKLPILRKNCRFQDNPNFSTKGRFGDDAEIFDQFWCGYCKPKFRFEGNVGPCEIPSPTLYSMKSRRSRDANIPMHETLEAKHPIDEITHEFARMSSRYAKDIPNTLRDRTRHTVQTAQGTTRMPVHYDS